MPIKEFEIFHGAVLTKLLRSERPLTLRLIETRPDDSWAVYTLNDEVDMYIKHSVSPRPLTRGKGGFSWTFTFSLEHKRQLRTLKETRPVCLVLICGQKDVKQERMEICLIKPDELSNVIDFNADEQKSITVRYSFGAKKLKIFLDRQETFSVFLNALDNWEVPGN